MKLYYAPYACSLAPHIVMRELELPCESVKVDLKTHTLADGSDYGKINPKGYVPALELDKGGLLTEVAAILQYFGDRKPGLLAAPQTMRRYRTIEWLMFVSSELHKGFGPLFDPALPEAARQRAREPARNWSGVLPGSTGISPATGSCWAMHSAWPTPTPSRC